MLVEGALDPHIMGVASSAGAPRLAVLRLMLTDFRGYAASRLEVDERPVVLTGPNGAGKTNLLEAISFLSPGRGLRRAKLAEIDRRVPPALASDAPPGAWRVAATVASRRGSIQIGTGRDAESESGERRLVRIDGAGAKSQAALAEHLSLIWLTPAMDRLFQEASGPRRRFLDRLVYGFDPAHAARVSAYEQAMRERARLLRDGPRDPAWIEALEERMAEEGVAVAAARRAVTSRLDVACRMAEGPFPTAELALTGEVEQWLEQMPAAAVAAELRRRLAAARRLDGESGVTSVGPHRGDLAVRHGASGVMAAQCSTGEQKALLIAVMLAQARLQAKERGAAPVMLLDEVTAHLDAERRAALFAALLRLGVQAWLTGTERGLFAELADEAQFFGVAQGSIAPQ